MEVFRKPATAEWYYDSAQKVDAVEFPVGSWTGQMSVTFDGTKDKTGERHTTMRIRLDEADAERIYAGLMQGRKKEIRDLSAEVTKLRKQLRQVRRVAKAHSEKMQKLWIAAPAGSDTETQIRELNESFDQSLEKVQSNWKWSSW